MRENRKIQIFTAVLISLFIAVCGKKVRAAEPEQFLPDNVVVANATEDIKYVDEVIPVQYTDDLSLLTNMRYADNTYVYQDGKVYYRRYHKDSYEEAALWGEYDVVPGTKKEIVCVDADGVKTVLFTDEGYGDIYLIDNRFYMTDGKQCEKDGNTYTKKRLYSVDMQGKDRIDYGNGSIYAVDVERKIFILKMEEDNTVYYLMNYETGEKKPLLYQPEDNFHFFIKGYQDGWLYYEDGESDFSRLCAVSIEGKEKEIIAVTSVQSFNNEISYREGIQGVKVDENRIYFIYGGYDGTAHVFQGGTLISVKPDGTDYKAINVEDDDFYVSHDKGKTLIYFPRYSGDMVRDDEKYEMLVWDVEAEMCYCSDFPTNVYAIPDDSGKIVKIVMDIEKYITKWEGKDIDKIKYDDFYFADGVLYFKAEYSAYDRDTSMGWRDGYRRLHTDIYRLKIGEDKAEVLYSY